MTRFLFLITMLWASSASAQVLRDVLWVTNGGVYASAVVGNTLYLGGNFNRVGPATGGLMPSAAPHRARLARAGFFAGPLGCRVGDRECASFVAVVFLESIIERFEKRFFLMRVVLIGLGLRKVRNTVVRHECLLNGKGAAR